MLVLGAQYSGLIFLYVAKWSAWCLLLLSLKYYNIIDYISHAVFHSHMHLFLYSENEVAQSCPTFRDPWTVAHQAPLSMGFSRQEYWSALPFPFPVDLVTKKISLNIPHFYHTFPLHFPSDNHLFALCIYESISFLLHLFICFV